MLEALKKWKEKREANKQKQAIEIIKQAAKKIKESEETTKEQIIEVIWSLKDLVILEEDDGRRTELEDLQRMEKEELITMFEEIIKAAEEIIRWK